MKNKKPNQKDRYIVLVARSKKEMEKYLFSMCRFRGDNVVLSLKGNPVVPTLFKTRKEAEQKVGDQKIFLYHEKCKLKNFIRHLKHHDCDEEYPGIIKFVTVTLCKSLEGCEGRGNDKEICIFPFLIRGD